jgi:lipoate-protein ligase B
MEVHWLGRQPYEATWARQKALVEAIAAGDAPDTLLLVEHDPIFTLGRKAGAAGNVLAAGEIPVLQVERGGDVTYHGPGQLVGYPLLLLRDGERDLHKYLRNLEGWLIAVLADYGLEAERNEGLTGVWARGKKLASLGVAVRKWVTYHGFALNVAPDLGHFARLNPCGLEASVMASLASELGRAPAMDEVVERVLAHAPAAIGRTPLTGARR